MEEWGGVSGEVRGCLGGGKGGRLSASARGDRCI